jgi:tetratricopeptide (TPR) repeat protein
VKKILVRKNGRFPDKYWIYIILLFIFLAYSRVFSNQFTNWDDDLYILDNPFIKFNIENIIYIFSHYDMNNYHPITMLFYSIAYAIGGLNPWIYQLFSLTLHLANTYLVFVFVYQLLQQSLSKHKNNVSVALITSALFGLHPLQVESVAWMSELKTLLYTLFFLLSLIHYLKYTESGKTKYFIYSLVLFVFSVLSKAMAVSLVLSLPLIDYFLCRKVPLKNHLLEKTPFLMVSLVIGFIAIGAQGQALSSTGSNFPIFERAAFACYGLFMYVVKLIVPVNLSAYYCYPLLIGGKIPDYYYIFPLIIIPSIIWLIFAFNKNAWASFGSVFFLINIGLVLQLLPVGGAVMADRYVYVPSIGFFFIVGNLFLHIHEKAGNNRVYPWLGLSLYLLILSILTLNRTGIWKNSLSLWNDTIQKTGGKNNVIPLVNRGQAFVQLGKYNTSLDDFTKAISIDSNYSDAFYYRGMAKIDMNMFPEAVIDLSKAIQSNPRDIEAIIARGLARMKVQDIKGAFSDLNIAIEHRTKNPEVFAARGYLFVISSDFKHALADYNQAIKLNPNNQFYYKFRGISEVKLEFYQEAINDFNLFLHTMKDPSVYYFRGFAKYKSGYLDEGCTDIKLAKDLGYQKIDPALLIQCNL